MRFILLISLTVLFYNSCTASQSRCSAPECINSGNSDLSTMILCNACLVKGVSKSDSHLVFRHKLKSIGANNYGKKITDLNIDVLLLVFDHLYENDIMRLLKAELSPTVSAAVRNSFWREYKDYSFNIAPYNTIRDSFLFSKGLERVYFRSIKAIEWLKMIGSGMRILIVRNIPGDVSKCINECTGDTLIKLDLREIADDTFVNFKQPFEKLEELRFDYSDYNEVKANQLPLDQQFPNLRNLILEFGRRINYNLNFTTFPGLESLHLNDTNNYLTPNQIEVILRKNNQIRSLKINRLSQNLANFINRHLLNLENLTVSAFDIQDATQLENVKHLIFNSISVTGIEKLSCPSLESLHFQYVERLQSLQPWVEFLVNHQNLNRLTIDGCFGNDIHSALVILTINNDSLNEITIERSKDFIKSCTIFKVIEKNQKLQRLFILNGKLGDDTLNVLRESLGDDWNIGKNEGTAFLEKKN